MHDIPKWSDKIFIVVSDHFGTLCIKGLKIFELILDITIYLEVTLAVISLESLILSKYV